MLVVLLSLLVPFFWTISLCKNGNVRGKEKDSNKAKEGMPKKTLTTADRLAMSTTARSVRTRKSRKEEKTTWEKQDDGLKFAPLVDDDDLEPEGTHVDDIPDDKNPLLDKSVQSKLLPPHVLARSNKEASTMSIQKTQNSGTGSLRPMMDAPENLNDRNPELLVSTVPKGRKKRTKMSKCNEMYVASALKTPKRDGRKVQECSMTQGDGVVRSRGLAQT